jgi:chromosome partitioning protein
MFDSRLRLSNQVVEEVQKHFNDMVFDTIIQRNVKLSEAPSFGEVSSTMMQPAKELQIIYI